MDQGEETSSEWEDEEEARCCVVVNGSQWTRAGFAGEGGPRCVLPTVVGRVSDEDVDNMMQSVVSHWSDHSVSTKALINMIQQYVPFDPSVGYRAIAKRDSLSLQNPVERGIINNWEDMEALWRYTFKRALRFDPAEVPILMTEPPLNPKSNREKMTEIMFETFHTPGFLIKMDAVLPVYVMNTGYRGLVLDSGHGVTHVVPVYDGDADPRAIHRVDIAGQDIDDYLMKMLTAERGFRSAERDLVGDIKEKLCYVKLDYDSPDSTEGKEYQLPDGQVISIGSELFRAPECLFQPGLIGKSTHGIHRHIHESIMQCNVDWRQTLYSSVIISGGSTMFQGFAERLKKELDPLSFASVNVRVLSPIFIKDRQCPAWRGGSMIGEVDSVYAEYWVSKDQYEEFGSTMIHRGCF